MTLKLVIITYYRLDEILKVSHERRIYLKPNTDSSIFVSIHLSQTYVTNIIGVIKNIDV